MISIEESNISNNVKHTIAQQSSNSIVMVKPQHFELNEEAAADNFFMNKPEESVDVHQTAIKEFNTYYEELKKHGVNVTLFQPRDELDTPDCLFPNNWFSTHSSLEMGGGDGAKNTLVLYPMCHPNRRLERRPAIIEYLKKRLGNDQSQINIIDISETEQNGHYLEGTGALVLDRVNRVAYACISQRCHKTLAIEWADRLGYKLISFTSVDSNGMIVYHTNVILAICSSLAIVCLDSVEDTIEKQELLSALSKYHTVVPITKEQVNQFCGNVIEVRGTDDKKYLVCSQSAYDAFTEDERSVILKCVDGFITKPIPTIQSVGGGDETKCLDELKPCLWRDPFNWVEGVVPPKSDSTIVFIENPTTTSTHKKYILIDERIKLSNLTISGSNLVVKSRSTLALSNKILDHNHEFSSKENDQFDFFIEGFLVLMKGATLFNEMVSMIEDTRVYDNSSITLSGFTIAQNIFTGAQSDFTWKNDGAILGFGSFYNSPVFTKSNVRLLFVHFFNGIRGRTSIFDAVKIYFHNELNEIGPLHVSSLCTFTKDSTTTLQGGITTHFNAIVEFEEGSRAYIKSEERSPTKEPESYIFKAVTSEMEGDYMLDVIGSTLHISYAKFYGVINVVNSKFTVGDIKPCNSGKPHNNYISQLKVSGESFFHFIKNVKINSFHSVHHRKYANAITVHCDGNTILLNTAKFNNATFYVLPFTNLTIQSSFLLDRGGFVVQNNGLLNISIDPTLNNHNTVRQSVGKLGFQLEPGSQLLTKNALIVGTITIQKAATFKPYNSIIIGSLYLNEGGLLQMERRLKASENSILVDNLYHESGSLIKVLIGLNSAPLTPIIKVKETASLDGSFKILSISSEIIGDLEIVNSIEQIGGFPDITIETQYEEKPVFKVLSDKNSLAITSDTKISSFNLIREKYLKMRPDTDKKVIGEQICQVPPVYVYDQYCVEAHEDVQQNKNFLFACLIFTIVVSVVLVYKKRIPKDSGKII
eukprot:gene8055-9910_t